MYTYWHILWTTIPMDYWGLSGKSNTSCVIHLLINSLSQHVSILNQHINNFILFYNSCPTYNFHHRRHITCAVFKVKCLSIKLFYLIDRILRKIVLVTIDKKLNDHGHPFYTFRSPVPDYQVVDILQKFKWSINRYSSVCCLLLEKVFRIDKLILYSNIFQHLTNLLDIVWDNISRSY